MSAVRPLAALLAVVVSLVLQVTLFPHLAWQGVVPNLCLLVVVGAALTRGPQFAAVLGFVAGRRSTSPRRPTTSPGAGRSPSSSSGTSPGGSARTPGPAPARWSPRSRRRRSSAPPSTPSPGLALSDPAGGRRRAAPGDRGVGRLGRAAHPARAAAWSWACSGASSPAGWRSREPQPRPLRRAPGAAAPDRHPGARLLALRHAAGAPLLPPGRRRRRATTPRPPRSRCARSCSSRSAA